MPDKVVGMAVANGGGGPALYAATASGRVFRLVGRSLEPFTGKVLQEAHWAEEVPVPGTEAAIEDDVVRQSRSAASVSPGV